MAAFMMRLPADHQRHCILSLLIMPHNAATDYELPLLHWHLLFFFVLLFSPASAASENLSQQDVVFFAKADRKIVQKSPAYVLRDLKRKATFSLIVSRLLPHNAPRCVFCCHEQKARSSFFVVRFKSSKCFHVWCSFNETHTLWAIWAKKLKLLCFCVTSCGCYKWFAGNSGVWLLSMNFMY